MPAPLSARLLVDGLTGLSVATSGGGTVTLAGDPRVGDDLARIVRGAPSGIRLRRHAASFFQGNRFLVGALASAVVDAVPDGPVWDLYAGVGLFAAALCATGRDRVTAVEGDPVSGADLRANAAAFGGRLAVDARAVEDVLATTPLPAEATVIVDPPRTGLSKAVTAALAASAVRRIVYVSCDVATLARDLKASRRPASRSCRSRASISSRTRPTSRRWPCCNASRRPPGPTVGGAPPRASRRRCRADSRLVVRITVPAR